jgi:hypothetical protein
MDCSRFFFGLMDNINTIPSKNPAVFITLRAILAKKHALILDDFLTYREIIHPLTVLKKQIKSRIFREQTCKKHTTTFVYT